MGMPMDSISLTRANCQADEPSSSFPEGDSRQLRALDARWALTRDISLHCWCMLASIQMFIDAILG